MSCQKQEVLFVSRLATGPWYNVGFLANFRLFGACVSPFNIIIAKWGKDRKVAFRLRLPQKKIPVAFRSDRKKSRATGKWPFRLRLPPKTNPVPRHGPLSFSKGLAKRQRLPSRRFPDPSYSADPHFLIQRVVTKNAAVVSVNKPERKSRGLPELDSIWSSHEMVDVPQSRSVESAC